MQEQMRAMLPTFMAQLNNPEIQSLVTNPQAMSAMMQIQQGMEQLRQVAPSFATTYEDIQILKNYFEQLKILNFSLVFRLGLGTLPPPLNSTANTTPSPSITTSTASPPTSTARPGSDAFSNMMASMVS